MLDYAKGNKHQHELGLLQRLLDTFKAGDLVLADRGFSTYALMALLWLRNVQSLFRLHHARPRDFRKGKRLGKDDRLLVWPKPDNWQKPRFIPQSLWRRLPKELSVRMVRFTLEIPGYRTKSVTLITTLLDPKLYPAAELAQLYARRWRIELWFRDIKTSMGMETLRCLAPQDGSQGTGNVFHCLQSHPRPHGRCGTNSRRRDRSAQFQRRGRFGAPV